MLEENHVTRESVNISRTRRRNVLRTLRRKAGLTHDDLAMLVGHRRRSQISRFEAGARTPVFIAALVLEMILDCPARDLFPAAAARATRLLAQRLDRLIAAIPATQRARSRVQYKLERLTRLRDSLPVPASASALDPSPCPPRKRRVRARS
jgi:transcriptional regulator with XRE-family HTH domain